ncbi:galectin-6-like [Pseudophryne corroboree]|uniref:galectin-6-like n=1 Tax=Pseudophryne corroboree TaxID=495146 RepID=UPI0030819815
MKILTLRKQEQEMQSSALRKLLASNMALVPAPGYQPEYNPPIPYTTLIAGGLRQGMAVCIQALTNSKSNRFTVNFATGDDEGSDIALHMNARYDGRDRVVFNSRQGGTWGDEELKKEMPFKVGKPFVILFEITRNNYLVSASGERFYEFAHRIPLENVLWLQVTGDVEVQSLNILGCGPGVKGTLVLSALQTQLLPMMGPAALNPTVPFKAAIRGGMVPRRSAVIKGLVKSNAKSFAINFKVGYSNEIAFHLNPRLNKSTVVRNSFVNGVWGEEEKDLAKNPFKHGEFFEISVRAGEKHFKVFINGCHSFNYANRMPNLQQVDCLEVEGDVKLIFVFI